MNVASSAESVKYVPDFRDFAYKKKSKIPHYLFFYQSHAKMNIVDKLG